MGAHRPHAAYLVLPVWLAGPSFTLTGSIHSCARKCLINGSLEKSACVYTELGSDKQRHTVLQCSYQVAVTDSDNPEHAS